MPIARFFQVILSCKFNIQAYALDTLQFRVLNSVLQSNLHLTMNVPSQQLTAIQSMLTAGHRNLRIERHSLPLWGIPPGILWVISEHILTPAQLPDVTQRALAWLGLMLAVLAAIATLDWHWTRQSKAARDEAWSFIHRQVIKVWWLTMSLAALTTFAMFFFGGAYMVCSVWLVCLGIGLYVHGLFSEELLEWAGLLTILIGITGLFAQLPYDTLRWLTAAVFAIGLPVLGLMLDRGRHRAVSVRLVQMLGWLTAVMILPLSLEMLAHERRIPDQASVSLADYRADPYPGQGTRIVNIPAGTAIPVELELGGDTFVSNAGNPGMTLTTARSIELLVRNGELTGDVRLTDGDWQQSRRVRWISIPWVKAELTPEAGPRVTGSLIVQIGAR